MLHFLTFGTPDYRKQLDRIAREASLFQCFDTIQAASLGDLDNDFMINHSRFMETNAIGYGFWIWKPQIVLQKLRTMADGDVLVYADSGCNMNYRGKQKLLEYIELAKNESSTGVVCFQMPPHKEKCYTKQSLFELLDANEYKILDQIHATSFIIKKTHTSMNIVSDWSTISQQYQFIDERERHLQQPDFIDFRHDQSIWSLLNRKYGSYVISTDETYPPNRIDMPIWGSRIRKNADSPYKF
jgi:hypothetical protein